MNKLLQTVMTEGTGTTYKLSGIECFGKTGTTNDNKERGYVSGAAGQVARIEGDSCGGGNCLNLTFCVLAKEDSPATREQGPNSDVEDALNMGWEKISPGEEGFCWVRG